MTAHTYIRKVKRAKGDGLWGSYAVDEDEHGLWLYTPQGSLYQATSGDEVAFCYVGRPDAPGVPVIHVIPATGWWFARWQGSHVAIDICTPSRLSDNVWAYDDLELDLFKFTDGRCGVTDEDEFEEAIAAGHISEDERRVCLDTAANLEGRLRAGDQLFDEIGWRKLAECEQRSFAPLVEFP